MGWRLCHLCSLLPTGGRAGPAGQGAASDPDICLPWPYAQQIRVHFGLIPGWGGQGLSTTVRFTPERFPSGRPSPKAAAQHHLAELGHWVVLLLHESRRARLWPRPSPLAPPPRGLGRAPCSPRPPAPCQLCLSRPERDCEEAHKAGGHGLCGAHEPSRVERSHRAWVLSAPKGA